MEDNQHVATECPNCQHAAMVPLSWLNGYVYCSACGAEVMLIAVAAPTADPTPYQFTPAADVAGNSRSLAPRIAIIGTEGSGKTVLVTTLAKRFSRSASDGAFLYPLNNETMRYVERNWQALQAGDWPAGTPLGQMVDLWWRLEIRDDSPTQCELRMLDAAGQDLRRWLSDDEHVPEPDYPQQLKALIDYCKSAEIVICLVNLKDFLGEGDPERKRENEIAVTSALRRLSSDPTRRLCLLFSQVDQYQETLKRHGGDWNRIAREFLPYVHGAQLSKGQAIVRAVASVDKTRVVVGEDGRPRRVPAPDYRSFGFDGLMNWLVREIRSIAAARIVEVDQAEAVRTQRAEEEKWELIGGALGLIGIVAVAWVSIAVVKGAVAWLWSWVYP